MISTMLYNYYLRIFVLGNGAIYIMQEVFTIGHNVLDMDQGQLVHAWNRPMPEVLNESDKAEVTMDASDSRAIRIHIQAAARQQYSFDSTNMMKPYNSSSRIIFATFMNAHKCCKPLRITRNK